jgi:hypothetical protein
MRIMRGRKAEAIESAFTRDEREEPIDECGVASFPLITGSTESERL